MNSDTQVYDTIANAINIVRRYSAYYRKFAVSPISMIKNINIYFHYTEIRVHTYTYVHEYYIRYVPRTVYATMDFRAEKKSNRRKKTHSTVNAFLFLLSPR